MSSQLSLSREQKQDLINKINDDNEKRRLELSAAKKNNWSDFREWLELKRNGTIKEKPPSIDLCNLLGGKRRKQRNHVNIMHEKIRLCAVRIAHKYSQL